MKDFRYLCHQNFAKVVDKMLERNSSLLHVIELAPSFNK